MGSKDFEDSREASEAESVNRPRMPMPDAGECFDLMQQEQPAWVNQLHKVLKNFFETKIDERFNELPNNLCKRLEVAEKNIGKLQSNHDLTCDIVRIVESISQANSYKINKLEEEVLKIKV